MSVNLGIIICNFNKKEYLQGCLSSLYESDFDNLTYEIIVVDNASTDDSVQFVQDNYREITLLENEENLGGSGGFDRGIRYAIDKNYKYVALLDNDILLEENTIINLIKHIEQNPKVGVVGSKICTMDNPEVLQEMGSFIDFETTFNIQTPLKSHIDNDQLPEVVVCDYVPACCLVTTNKVLNKVGSFDTKHFIYWDDMDWCTRVKKAGYEVHAINSSRVFHKMNSGNDDTTLSSVCKKSVFEQEFVKLCSNPIIRVVSFDVFDTLVHREVLQPEQVFLLMGKEDVVIEYFDYAENFQQHRIIAEQKARKLAIQKEVTIEQIYEELNLPKKVISTFIELEIEYEKNNIARNPQIDNWIKIAHAFNKRVICISDMYLDVDQINSIAIDKLENREYIEKVYVSSEQSQRKSDGGLYRTVLKQEQISEDEMLHIGDNLLSDQVMASKIGVVTLLLRPSKNYFDALEHEESYSTSSPKFLNCSQRRIATLLNPYDNEGERFFYEVGATIFAPVLYYFSIWLLELARKKNISQIMTIMREGAIFQYCLEQVKSSYPEYRKIEIILAYISRKSLILPFFESTNQHLYYKSFTIYDLFSAYNLKIPSQIQKYKNISLSEAVNINVDNETLSNKISQIISQHTAEIHKNSAEQQKFLTQYLKQLNCKQPLAVDIGSGGSIFKQLDKLTGNLRPKHYALMNKVYHKITLHNLDSFFPIMNRTSKGLKTTTRSPEIMELLLNGNNGTTLSYKKNNTTDQVEPITAKVISSRNNAKIRAFQQGVRSYFCVLSPRKAKTLNLHIDKRVEVTQSFTRLFEFPTQYEAEMLGELEHELDFAGDKTTTIVNKKPNSDSECLELLSSNIVRTEYEWPTGAITQQCPELLRSIHFKGLLENQTIINAQVIINTINKLSDNKKISIVIWGAGDFGEILVKNLLLQQNITIKACIDLRAEFESFKIEGIKVLPPNKIPDYLFDILIIASAEYKDNIIKSYRSICNENSIKTAKIISC